MTTSLLNQTKRFSRFLAILGIGLAASSASAQLNGTSYTINAGGTASSTNFLNLLSFSQALNQITRNDAGPAIGTAVGVTGPVKVTFLSNTTEPAMVIFYDYASNKPTATNTITIDGGKYVASYGGTYEVISFQGSDYFRMRNLTIRHTGTSATASAGIRISGGTDYSLIENCTIEFSAMVASTTSGSAYVHWGFSAGAVTSATSSNTGSYDTLRNCVMQTTGTNPAGPAIAISIAGNTSTYSSTPMNNTIIGNTIKNFCYMGIFNYYTNGNQILNNDISRANATSSSACYAAPYLTYSYYTYSTNRSTKIDGNNVHDLPYAGASAASTTNYYQYFYNYLYYNYGNATNAFSFSNNTFKNIMAYYYCYAGYAYYNYRADYVGNTYDNIQTYASGYQSYILQINYGTDANVSKNKIVNCSFGYYGHNIYMYQVGVSLMTENICSDNVMSNSYAGYYYYGIETGYMYVNISRNKIIKNTTATNQGYFWGIYSTYNYSWKLISNVIADNFGYYGSYNVYSYSYNSGNYSFECRQNTVKAIGSTYSYCYVYVFLCQEYYFTDFRFAGNIVDVTGGYYGYPAYLYNTSANSMKELDNNTYFIRPGALSAGQYWYNPSGSASDFAGWKGTNVGPGENWNDPNFLDPSNGDYRSGCFETQNNALTVSSNPKDVNSATRNPVKSDRGGQELFMDLKGEACNFSVPASVCQGYSTSAATTFTVRNLFSYDTAYKFNVAYSVNGGAKTTAVVKKKTLYNDTAIVTFNANLVLNTLGNNSIKFFVDHSDDNPSNDTLFFTTFVKPAPGGEKLSFSPKPTKAIYQYGKPNDITILGQPVIYNYTPPKGTNTYANSDYNTKWSATAWAVTTGGVGRPASEITTNLPATGALGSDMEVQFLTSDASIEDSTVWVYLRVYDITNSCDTVIRRKVLVYPTITPLFTFPSKICDGDAVEFLNQSKVKSGSIEFGWNFGTGNIADSTDAPEPIFQFPSPGTYKVTMTARTLPYGFTVTYSQNVVVSPIPTVKFTKLNACEGKALVFTSQTSPPTATSSWDFGDPTNPGNTSSSANPTKIYKNTGTYIVTLTASLNGCTAEASQRVYQFDKPVPKWNLVSGSCDNDEFMFDNLSTIKTGLVGAIWNFNDGNVATEDDPSHMFTSPGTKKVKLIATSEFGCQDSLEKNVIVRESPTTSFTNTPACSLTPTTFTNLTSNEAGNGANYGWDFGDGTTSTASSPVHPWSTLGPKTVMFTVTFANGCKASASADLSVGVQPKASFTAMNVCAGDPVIFENGTTWAQGDISYNWNFGDATTSTNSDPSHSYVGVSTTTTFFVTLDASIAGGCSDKITKSVTVNEGPKTCDFANSPDYAFGFHGMKFTPLDGAGTQGAQSGVTYTWVVKGGGTINKPVAQYDFLDDGEYEITMRAHVDATGCECTVTKKVIMNRAQVEELETAGLTVFPNPSNGNFNIALTENFGSDINVEIMNLTGAVVKTMKADNNGLIAINAGDLTDGTYVVRVRSNKRTATRKITVRR